MNRIKWLISFLSIIQPAPQTPKFPNANASGKVSCEAGIQMGCDALPFCGHFPRHANASPRKGVAQMCRGK